MKNKRGGVVGILLIVLLTLVLGGIVVEVIASVVEDFKEYKEYEKFCEEREDFCLCDLFTCEFKPQWSSGGGLSRDTKELCELAEELEDKKMMFRVGCE